MSEVPLALASPVVYYAGYACDVATGAAIVVVFAGSDTFCCYAAESGCGFTGSFGAVAATCLAGAGISCVWAGAAAAEGYSAGFAASAAFALAAAVLADAGDLALSAVALSFLAAEAAFAIHTKLDVRLNNLTKLWMGVCVFMTHLLMQLLSWQLFLEAFSQILN